MIRINHYFINGAIALLSTAGFVACSSSDDVTEAPVNPSYDGKSVKTQFAINIATPSNSKTRMSSDNTQNNSNYLGMDKVRLLTLATTPGNATELTTVIPLANPDNAYNPATGNSNYIYSDVNIPIGTSDFLFYATRGTLGTAMADKFKTGAIESTMFNNASPSYLNTSEITFASEKILSGNNSVDEEENAFENYLNNLISVSGWSTTSNQTLQTAYNSIRTSYTNGQYAGSANAIKKLMTDLYNVVNPIATSTTASDDDKTLATNIKNKILNTGGAVSFEVDNTQSTGNVLKYASTVSENISDFPCKKGLPEGAALLTFNSTDNEFKYNTAPQIGGTNKVNSYNLTYPLPVIYFDNTPAKGNDKEFQTSDWQNTTSKWDYQTGWTTTNGWYDGVKATSRTIALKNNINYGVACLKTTFTCDGTTLLDNRNAIISGESAQTITIPSNGFQVTGILIGGQPLDVNWQFVNTGVNRDYVVYDKELTNIYAKRSQQTSTTNYTLVFDNWTSASTGQEPVNIAIELVNTAADFYGVDGIVAKGQKFYLVGRLDPATNSTIIWPTYDENQETNHLLSSYEGRYPVKSGTANTPINRVFVQDYTTTANFTIKSLKNAYVTIPDLRAAKLQLGLSVDLNWQSGLTFNVDL